MSVAFLFPGQGAQTVGMGRGFAEAFPPSARLFEIASETLNADIAKLCFEGPQEELNRTDRSQPALLTASLAALTHFRAKLPSVQPAAFAGLSLGEITALAAAGALAFKDALRLVQVRGAAMQEACDRTPSGMVSILGLDRARVEQAVAEAAATGIVGVANLNSPGQIVISGAKEPLALAAKRCTELGARRAIPLAVAGAYHSAVMEPARVRFVEALASTRFDRPKTPIVSNVDAKFRDDPEEIRDALGRQIVHPVLWEDSLRSMAARGISTFYEFGPGKVLCGLVRKTLPEAKAVPVETPADVEALCAST